MARPLDLCSSVCPARRKKCRERKILVKEDYGQENLVHAYK
jgi:hypothetical protein